MSATDDDDIKLTISLLHKILLVCCFNHTGLMSFGLSGYLARQVIPHRGCAY